MCVFACDVCVQTVVAIKLVAISSHIIIVDEASGWIWWGDDTLHLSYTHTGKHINIDRSSFSDIQREFLG